MSFGHGMYFSYTRMESGTRRRLRIRLFDKSGKIVKLELSVDKKATINEVAIDINALGIDECPDSLDFRMPMSEILSYSTTLNDIFEKFDEIGLTSWIPDAHDPTLDYYIAIDAHFHRPTNKEPTKDESKTDINLNSVQIQLEELKGEIKGMRRDMKQLHSLVITILEKFVNSI
jgi:hypothetical protein